MKTFLLICLFSLSVSTFASNGIGETAPNLCWTNENSQPLCMGDMKGEIRVLLYNGGFCEPCNMEFEELIPQAMEFDGKPVQFLSLSVAGWEATSKPTPEFLKEWKERHLIPFPVLASSRQELYGFIENAKLPSVVIIDKDGKVAFAEIGPGVEATFAKIRQLLSQP